MHSETTKSKKEDLFTLLHLPPLLRPWFFALFDFLIAMFSLFILVKFLFLKLGSTANSLHNILFSPKTGFS